MSRLGEKSGFSTARLAIAVGVGCFALAVALQWPGVILSPDGWAYWEGSVSLLRGDGYRWFGGQPITLWPPGFPIYLAIWQALLGTNAGALALAHAAALGLAAAFWMWIYCIVARPPSRTTALDVLVAVSLPPAIALHHQAMGSESMAMALVAGAVLLVLGRHAGSVGGRLAAVGVLAFVLLVTRNAGVAFLPGLAFLVLVVAPRVSRRRETVAAMGASLAAIAGWEVVRRVLRQAGSHPLSTPTVDRLGEVGAGLVRQLADLAGPHAYWIGGALLVLHTALMAYAVTSHQPAQSEPRRLAPLAPAVALVGFTAISLLAVWLLVAIASPLETIFGRFALFAAPVIVVFPAWASGAARARAARRLAWVLVIATTSVQLARTAYWLRHAAEAPPSGIAWNRCLGPQQLPTSPAEVTPDCVAPPDYPWIRRDFAAERR